MKKRSLCLALFCMAVQSFAQVNMMTVPKVAVYVADGGQGRQAGELLGTLMLEALVNSGMYVAIERSEEFLKELDNEHLKQRSGAVDESQISRLGKQAGVDVVCVVKVASGIGDYQLSARMIDVETARVIKIGVVHSSLRGADNMTAAANELVGKIMGTNASASKLVSGVARASESGGAVGRQQSASPTTLQPPEVQPPKDNPDISATSLINTYPPQAYIYIDGKNIGVSNSNKPINVPVGTHQVTFIKGGIETIKTITFEPGFNRKNISLGDTMYVFRNTAHVNYRNITAGDSVGTMFLNFIFPGWGSGAIMKDRAGVGITWVLIGGGLAIGAMTQSAETGAAISCIGGWIIFNGIIRPLTYNKPVPKPSADNANPYGDVKFAVLPDQNGDFKAVVAYELSF